MWDLAGSLVFMVPIGNKIHQDLKNRKDKNKIFIIILPGLKTWIKPIPNTFGGI